MEKDKIKKYQKVISDSLDTQRSNGNWNHNQYMHGMANGLILADAVLNEQTPEYLDAPDAYIEDTRGLNLVYANVKKECERQDSKWGSDRLLHPLVWLAILAEEFGEVSKEVVEFNFHDGNLNKQLEIIDLIKTELVQVAAVAVQFVNSLELQYAGVKSEEVAEEFDPVENTFSENREIVKKLEKLSNDELRFIRRVMESPGEKITAVFPEMDAEDNEHRASKALFVEPEKLGLIYVASPYRFRPTKKLERYFADKRFKEEAAPSAFKKFLAIAFMKHIFLRPVNPYEKGSIQYRKFERFADDNIIACKDAVVGQEYPRDMVREMINQDGDRYAVFVDLKLPEA